ncbi:MAG: MFS transporter [Caldilineaceae bacterium]
MTSTTLPETKNSPSDISFLRLITTGISTKLIIDSGFQIFNPFLPIIATGLGADLTIMGRLISLRNLVGLAAPIAGTVGDRVGYRRVIRFGMLVLIVGMLLLGSSSSIIPAMIAMICLGFSHVCVTPILQAYISSKLPYSQRGRAIGMLEYSWALTGIVGLSLIGFLIQWTNWRVPFFVLAACMAVMWVIFGAMPDVKAEGAQRRFNLIDIFRVEENRRSTYATIAVGALSYFAGSQMMLIYGQWLKTQYGLQPFQLGTVAFGLGWSDLLLGSVMVSLITDRIGKRVSLIIGLIVSAVGYFVMPLFNTAVIPAVVSMALTRGGFEFAIVSNISLLSEQTPKQRGKALTLGGAVWQLLGAVTGIVTPWIFEQWGMLGVTRISGIAATVAILIAVTLVKEVSD